MSSTLLITLSVVAFIIIAALGGIAAYYVWQVKKQRQEKRKSVEV